MRPRHLCGGVQTSRLVMAGLVAAMTTRAINCHVIYARRRHL
jgi:hypothetical protein